MPILTIMIPVYNQEQLVLRALESIPKRKDVELLIIDDCSRDNSLTVLQEWQSENEDRFFNIVIKYNPINMGCGFGKNWAYSAAKGEYIITVDSDDYVYTDKYNSVIDRLYNLDADIIFIGNTVNNGETWSHNDRKATWSYFVKNSFLKESGLNYDPNARRAGDLELTNALRELDHSEIILGDVVYHYNYPREGSIVWNHEHEVN